MLVVYGEGGLIDCIEIIWKNICTIKLVHWRSLLWRL